VHLGTRGRGGEGSRQAGDTTTDDEQIRLAKQV
jgi:hypothetical protein